MKTLSASVVLAFVLWSETSLAQSAPLPAYVQTRLPPACQGVVEFPRRLFARTQRLRWAYSGEPGIVFDVAVQAYPTGLVGQLEIRELSGRVTQRVVQGSACDGVLDALAFVAAVFVDSEPEPAPSQTPPEPKTLPEPDAPRPPRQVEPEFADFHDKDDQSTPLTRYSVAVGITGGLTTATAPGLQPNVGIRASLTWTNPYVDPWIMLGFDQRIDTSTHSSFSGAAVDTVFGGWALHAAASPIRWPTQGPYALRPLVLFEVGQITSSATNAQNVLPSGATSRTWLAAGLGVSAEAPLASPIAVVADFGVEAPLRRLAYYYRAGSAENQPFSVPSAGLNVRLGVIMKFE